MFVAGAGTGGTIRGAGRYLSEKGSKVVCVEPTESRALVGQPGGIHGIVGIGAGIELELIEGIAPGAPWQEGPRGFVSDFAHCATPDAIGFANRLAAEEGLLVGPTSGAVAKICCDIAGGLPADKTVVGIVASSGIRYVKRGAAPEERVAAPPWRIRGAAAAGARIVRGDAATPGLGDAAGGSSTRFAAAQAPDVGGPAPRGRGGATHPAGDRRPARPALEERGLRAPAEGLVRTCVLFDLRRKSEDTPRRRTTTTAVLLVR